MIGLLCVALAAASPEADVLAAQTALAASDFAAAEASYTAVIAEGGNTGDVWYNLGNVLYRADRPAEAALAWLKAGARQPRDPDIEANLDFVRRGFVDGLVAPTPHPWFAPWQVALTPDEGIWIGSALVGLGLLLVAGRRHAPGFPLLAFGVGCATVGGLIAAGGWSAGAEAPLAVVLVPEATATSDLGGGVDLFTLHAGAEVQTAGEAAQRTLVVLPDGRKGWLPNTSLGVVDPSLPPPVL